MKTHASILILVIILMSCGKTRKEQQAAENQSESIGLEMLWATDTILSTPESVIYDSARQFIYVSNVNNNPWEKDGNGFLSRLDMKGNVVSPFWVGGLNGPKGMALKKDMLYVADIDALVKINITTGEIVEKITIENAKALNDLTISDNGVVYISDSGADCIYQYLNGRVDVLVENIGERPNGLFVKGDHLYLVCSNSHNVVRYNLRDKTRQELSKGIGHGDGIMETNRENCFILSDWQGEVFYFSSDKKLTSLLRTKEDGVYSADIWFIKEKSMVLIPTFFDNRVLAYTLKE